jgi:hypothetical protein
MPRMPTVAKSLAEVIGFGELDLAANRRGRASEAQRARFEKWDEKRGAYDELNHRLAVIASAVLLAGALVALGFGTTRAFALPAPFADKEVVTLLSLAGMMALFGVLSLLWGASRARSPGLQILHYVESIEGHVLFNPREKRGLGSDVPNFDIEGLHFSVTEQVARAFVHGGRYRLYYVATVYALSGTVTRSLTILSAELLLDS